MHFSFNGRSFVLFLAELSFLKMLHYSMSLSRLRSCGVLFIFSFLLLSCGPEATTIVSKLGNYDLAHPAKVMKLPPLLDEISGITYYAKDSSLFAVQDEEGFIYKISLVRPDSLLRYKFAGHGDFEDVALVDSTLYVLRSNGTIYATTIGTAVNSIKYPLPAGGDEFEGLFLDDSLHQLRLLCKDCKEDGKKHVSTWLFNQQSNQFSNDSMRVNAGEIAQMLGEKKIKFKPSAISFNPRNHKIYVLSSVNSAIAVVNRDGSIEQCCALDPKIFKQPEGLAFAPDGTMFISNESADVGVANILIIPYHTTR